MIDNYVAENVEKEKNKLSISMIAQYKKEFYWARLLHYSYTRKEKKQKEVSTYKGT